MQVPTRSLKHRKDGAVTARSSSHRHWAVCRKSRPSGILGILMAWIFQWSHLEANGNKGSNAIANILGLAKQPCLTPPGHEELSTSRSCKFHKRGAVVVNPSQETADELWQLCFLKYTKDPRMIDARICSGSLSIRCLPLVERTQHGQGSTLDLENVISHMPGWDASLGWICTSHLVPAKTYTNCCGEYLAIASTQCQRT